MNTYSADANLSCNLPTPSSGYGALVNSTIYNNSYGCGTCVEVTNTATAHKITVPVLGHCPDCSGDDINLSAQAYLQIANGSGAINVSWKVVDCPIAGDPLTYIIADYSDALHGQLTVYKSRFAIMDMYFETTNGNVQMTHQTDNVFTYETTPDNPIDYSFPIIIHATDINGATVRDIVRPGTLGTPEPGIMQMPFCGEEIFKNDFEPSIWN
jgi:expansin (peptidoglycan-binding protein)